MADITKGKKNARGWLPSETKGFYCHRLILLQRAIQLFYPILCNHHHLQPIAHFNVSLHRTCKRIPYKLLCNLPRKRLCLSWLHIQDLTVSTAGNILILEIHLVIQEWHDQTRRCTGCSALLPLIRSDRVIAIERSFPILV